MKTGMQEYLAVFQHRALVDIPDVEFSVRRTRKEPDSETYVVRLRMIAGDRVFSAHRATMDVDVCGAHISPTAFAVLHSEHAIRKLQRAMAEQ